MTGFTFVEIPQTAFWLASIGPHQIKVSEHQQVAGMNLICSYVRNATAEETILLFHCIEANPNRWYFIGCLPYNAYAIGLLGFGIGIIPGLT